MAGIALSAATALRSGARADTPLPGAALQVLCGLAWLGVAWAFSFLDRGHGDFAFFAAAWAFLGLVGFGIGIGLRERPAAARTPALVLTVLACLLALFPGFLMYVLVRWAAFGLLLVTAARAAAMHTRRDLYYALAAIVAVSLLVVSHDRAQWTVWFYLAPAWLCVGLALAWDYAAEVRLGAPLKAGMTVAFLAFCIVLGATLSALLPLPQVDGFGFLEPGTDHPGRVQLPAGGGGGTQGSGGKRGGTAEGQGHGAQGASGGEPGLLGGVAKGLHEALRDRGLPGWQRGTVEGLLSITEALARLTEDGEARVFVRPMTAQERQQMEARAAALQAALDLLLNLLWLALAALLLWRLRWRVAATLALGAAGLLVRVAPGASMRCSMQALRCLLHRHGHPRGPAQSVLEHVDSAPFLPPRLRQWLREAVHTYGAWRFGSARGNAAQARQVRQAISAAGEVLRIRRNG